jgi:hypothetical protein
MPVYSFVQLLLLFFSVMTKERRMRMEKLEVKRSQRTRKLALPAVIFVLFAHFRSS